MFIILLYHLCQQAFRSVQLRSRTVFLDAEQTGYLLMALAFEDIEIEHRAVADWQAAQHLLDDIGRNIADRRFGIFQLVSHVLVQLHELMPLLRPQELQRLIDHHLRHPRLQGTCSAILEIAYVSKDMDKSVLEHVLEVVLIVDVSRTDSCKIVSVKGIELTGSRFIAVLNTLY